MTCVVALRENGATWLGGDSAATRGQETRATTQEKVFRLNGTLVGYTSSFRMGQLLQHELELPDYNVGSSYFYMVRKFVPAVRKLFKDSGYARIDSNEEGGGEFIVCLNEHIFTVYSDYAVLEHLDPFHAIGCGADYALGALEVLYSCNMAPSEKVMSALAVAAKFSSGVAAPFNIVHLN